MQGLLSLIYFNRASKAHRLMRSLTQALQRYSKGGRRLALDLSEDPFYAALRNILWEPPIDRGGNWKGDQKEEHNQETPYIRTHYPGDIVPDVGVVIIIAKDAQPDCGLEPFS